MLSAIIVTLVVSYFLTIPLIVKFICLVKNKKVPDFFIHSEPIVFISLGLALTLTLFNVGNDYADLPVWTRIYVIVTVIGMIAFKVYLSKK